MKLFFKAFILFLLAGFLISSLYATETRVATMGGTGFYLRDNSNIFVFPGTFYQYKSQAIAELRIKNDDQSYTIGVHIPVDTTNVLGVYLNRPMLLALPSIGLNYVSIDQVTDIFYGLKLKGCDLGINLTLGFDSYTDDVSAAAGDTYEESMSYVAIASGISNDKLDAGIKLEIPSASGTEDSLENTVDGLGLGVNFRYFFTLNPRVEAVPLAVVYYGSASSKEDLPAPATDYKVDYTILSMALGIGANFHLNDKNLMVLGLEALGYSKNTIEVKHGGKQTLTTMTMPAIYLGIESHISKWFIGRLGAAQVMQKMTVKYEELNILTESISYNTQFKMTFGLGISFGSFLLDASINEGLLFDGPNLISGTTEAMANRLSITYSF